MEILLLPLLFQRPFKCIRCFRRFYAFSLSPGTRKRARNVLLLLAGVTIIAFGLWQLMQGILMQNHGAAP